VFVAAGIFGIPFVLTKFCTSPGQLFFGFRIKFNLENPMEVILYGKLALLWCISIIGFAIILAIEIFTILMIRRRKGQQLIEFINKWGGRKLVLVSATIVLFGLCAGMILWGMGVK